MNAHERYLFDTLGYIAVPRDCIAGKTGGENGDPDGAG